MIQNPSKQWIYALTADNDKVKFHGLYTEQILEESAEGNIFGRSALERYHPRKNNDINEKGTYPKERKAP